MRRRFGWMLIVAFAIAVPSPAVVQAAPADPVFDMDVSLVSANVLDGTGYVWTYLVSQEGDNNRGLSHWVLSICDPQNSWNLGEEDMLFFDLSFFSGSDPYFYTSGNGVNYEVEFGTDPTTGVKGIKYGHDDVDGTQIGDTLTSDTFQFRLTEEFPVVTRNWSVKDGNLPQGGGPLVEFGTVDGPDCVPDGPNGTGPPIPEPATLLLLGLGALGSGVIARRRRR